MTLAVWLHDFVKLFYPNVCLLCSQPLVGNEQYICIHCTHDLPETHFVFGKPNVADQIFWGRVPLSAATSLFWFEKGGKVQELLHQIKYKGHKELGTHFGLHLGQQIAFTEVGKTVNLICPVPLHPKKEKLRGFNQSYWIAKGLSQILHIPVSQNNLIRKTFTSTQTRKSRLDRWENVSEVFSVSEPRYFDQKHVLLVDDVLTTGATLEACAQAILKHANCKVSVASLAIAVH